MRKRNVDGTAHQPPAIARAHFSAAGVDSVAERSNNSNIRKALDDVPLSSKPLGMRDVVGIHARHYRSTRLCHYRVRAPGESEPLFAFVKTYSLIPERPLPQYFDSTIRGSIIENYKFKVAQSLFENAAYALGKEGHDAVYCHNNANK